MKNITDILNEAICHGWSPNQLRRKKAGKPVYEAVKNEGDAVKMIVACLDEHDVLYDICEAADKGKIDIRSFKDEYGEKILDGIQDALMECWNDNF